MRIFDRLFVKVYLTVAAALLLVVIVSALIWRTGPEMETARSAFGMASGVAAAALADPGAPPAEQQRAIERLSRLLGADLAVYAPDGTRLGAHGATLPHPGTRTDWQPWRMAPHDPVWSFRIADGRTIVVRPPFERRRRWPNFIFHLGIIALLLAIGSYPVVRGLTHRLEKLQQGVETLGAGNLGVRVEVHGRDEVARLAASFNRAASRIEDLVRSHRMLLANASHELRTPLTRLRLGIEMLKEKADPVRQSGLERDIAELDELIGSILLSSRLDAMQHIEQAEDVDLLALAAEEASRFDDIAVDGEPVTVRADSRLLRHLIRNLIDNALRHGKPPVALSVTSGVGEALLRVGDAGPVIPVEVRERIFEPFWRRPSGREEWAGAGSGLGLALVRQIAQAHGGSAAYTAPGEGGGAFLVSLPLGPASPTA